MFRAATSWKNRHGVSSPGGLGAFPARRNPETQYHAPLAVRICFWVRAVERAGGRTQVGRRVENPITARRPWDHLPSEAKCPPAVHYSFQGPDLSRQASTGGWLPCGRHGKRRRARARFLAVIFERKSPANPNPKAPDPECGSSFRRQFGLRRLTVGNGRHCHCADGRQRGWSKERFCGFHFTEGWRFACGAWLLKQPQGRTGGRENGLCSESMAFKGFKRLRMAQGS